MSFKRKVYATFMGHYRLFKYLIIYKSVTYYFHKITPFALSSKKLITLLLWLQNPFMFAYQNCLELLILDLIVRNYFHV